MMLISSKHWCITGYRLFTESKNRDIEDILIVYVESLNAVAKRLIT